MSQKWIRSKRWDDEHIPRALWPVKFVLRTFSSIPLAVVLLVFVAIYGTLASTPLGLLAAIPTFLLYGLTLAVLIGLPALLAWRLTRPLSLGIRFPLLLVLNIAFVVGGGLLWRQSVWPALRYDELTGKGFMLFAQFVHDYKGVTLRRLPGMEMSELEFYAWWPLRLALLLFVLNLVVATLRRIEFSFPNIGVLTVHTGIVTIALGSVYYAAGKQEGDMLLRSGPPDATGRISPGPIEDGFYDRTLPVLWIGTTGPQARYEQRPLHGLPRYNDYNLNVLGTGTPDDPRFHGDNGRTLRLDVPAVDPATDRTAQAGSGPVVGPDVKFEIVGYSTYTSLVSEWAPVPGDAAGGDGSSPMRSIELISSVPDQKTGDATPRSIGSFRFVPSVPSMRWSSIGGAINVEYTRGMSAARWNDLNEPLPPNVEHALVVEVPGAGGQPGHRQVVPVQVGARIEVGTTGYTLEVKSLADQPPMPIITPGYENAMSSIAIVRVTPPGAGGAYERWVYHRFPEISQDLLDEKNERGMPKRRSADPAIRIGYIDATAMQVYLDESTDAGGNDPAVRAIVRVPGRGMNAMVGAGGSGGGPPLALADLHTGRSVTVLPVLALKLDQRWPSARNVEIPTPVPVAEQRRDAIGTHMQAAIAVRVSTPATPWSTTLWVPFTQYLGIDQSTERRVTLPDGRELTLVFGRKRYTLPGLSLQLTDFEMIPYPHSDTPRDYRSDVMVYRRWRGQSSMLSHATSLNNPLLASAFAWSKERGALANALDWVMVRLSPLQYKFSQAGWDQPGWSQAKAMVDRGEIQRPFARFTILGVGNNPGIYVIAAGAIMMSVGIPWAFYLKPLILKARAKRLKAELATAKRTGGTTANGVAAPTAEMAKEEHR